MKKEQANQMKQTPLSGILAASTKPIPKAPRHNHGEKFIKGPIPWGWIAQAANLSGGALKVSLAIWQLAGMKKSRKVKLSNRILGELGVSRNTKYRALSDLESAGLISVSHKPGNSPGITILPYRAGQ
jgi:DNA-binding MarR family transcriptional regulator